jgi:hypothetical protein
MLLHAVQKAHTRKRVGRAVFKPCWCSFFLTMRRLLRCGGGRCPAAPASQPSGRIPLCVPRLMLLRHGESQGNLDSLAYVTTPDWK